MLLKEGKRVRIGSRALSLLKVLAAHAGHFVSNDMLIAAAWPNTHVEDTNLRVQMTALRQLLGGDDCMRITNAPGRGYALTVEPAGARGDDAPAPPLGEAGGSALPTQLTSLVGREGSVAIVVKRLSAARFVAVVGPGGIGKTRVAIEACVRLMEEGWPADLFRGLRPAVGRRVRRQCGRGRAAADDEARVGPVERSSSRCDRAAPCWCSTVASMFSTTPPSFPRNCFAPFRTSASWPRAASLCLSKAK